MNLKCLFGLFVRVLISVVFAGIFYVGWLAVAIPVIKFGPLFAKALVWLSAPVVTGAALHPGLQYLNCCLAQEKANSAIMCCGL